MKKLFHTLFPLAWFVVLFGGISAAYAAHAKQQNDQNTAPSIDTIKTITEQSPSLNPKVLRLALLAYHHARLEGLDKQEMLTIINYNDPSTDKRLWVINLNNDKVVFNTFVAHGKNSGNDYADRFSNQPTSEESSLGVFLTGPTFYGNDGYSMRLYGLEQGFNNNAYARDIVMHGAWYVNQQFINQYGRLGRSWGCPAVSKKMAPEIINKIKGGTLIFAYYPSKKWLDDSKYLTPLAPSQTV